MVGLHTLLIILVSVPMVVAVEGSEAVLEPSLEAKQFPHYKQQFSEPKTAAEISY